MKIKINLEQKFGAHITFGVKIKSKFFFNKWTEVNSYLAKLVLDEVGKNTKPNWQKQYSVIKHSSD